MLIAARSEQEAVNVAFSEDIPVENLNDLQRDVDVLLLHNRVQRD
jgi:hypothetical protein